MKKLILNILASSVLAFSTFAQTVLVTATPGGTGANITTNVFPNPTIATNVNVTRLTLLSATANVLTFRDGLTNSLFALGTYSNQAYTNWVTVDPYTNSVVFTNSLGRANTNTYIGQYMYATNVAAGTNTYPAIGTVSLQAGTPYTMIVNWNITRGLLVTATNAATVGVEFQ